MGIRSMGMARSQMFDDLTETLLSKLLGWKTESRYSLTKAGYEEKKIETR
jgi:hypothetical protein